MQKPPLYRSVNTRTHGVKHGLGGDYRNERNKKAVKASDVNRSSMRSHHRHGRDYTPLFRFLLSKVGGNWNAINAEATARLDTVEPIYWLVARTDTERQEVVRIGESTYFSGMFIDDKGVLRLVNPTLKAEGMQPNCTCCTHTFNGVRFGAAAVQPNPSFKPTR